MGVEIISNSGPRRIPPPHSTTPFPRIVVTESSNYFGYKCVQSFVIALHCLLCRFCFISGERHNSFDCVALAELRVHGGTAEKFPFHPLVVKEAFKRSKGKVSVWPDSGARIYTEKFFFPVNAIFSRPNNIGSPTMIVNFNCSNRKYCYSPLKNFQF